MKNLQIKELANHFLKKDGTNLEILELNSVPTTLRVFKDIVEGNKIEISFKSDQIHHFTFFYSSPSGHTEEFFEEDVIKKEECLKIEIAIIHALLFVCSMGLSLKDLKKTYE